MTEIIEPMASSIDQRELTLERAPAEGVELRDDARADPKAGDGFRIPDAHLPLLHGRLAGWLRHSKVGVCGYEDRGLAGVARPPVCAASCLGRQH